MHSVKRKMGFIVGASVVVSRVSLLFNAYFANQRCAMNQRRFRGEIYWNLFSWKEIGREATSRNTS